MALQGPFFGKREEAAPPSPLARPPATSTLGSASASGATVMGAGGAPQNLSSVPTLNTTAAPEARQSDAKLTVGPNIKLKGVEITDCDVLVVEGTVEASVTSRVIQIAEQGAFKGSAEIDVAEVHGAFDGDLTVREKLVIFATGKVTGKIRYGKIVIEEGGQLSGEITFGTADSGAKKASGGAA
ncbi:MAG: polymer-forming cytoskeletal protein [Proteobacteria bacterium]|jgi:cytoskeletal protein CcmA (bactofilin family)|nr:polymer-forming cytoskeletal protein [Pseudomonadota bacterium]